MWGGPFPWSWSLKNPEAGPLPEQNASLAGADPVDEDHLLSLRISTADFLGYCGYMIYVLVSADILTTSRQDVTNMMGIGVG